MQKIAGFCRLLPHSRPRCLTPAFAGHQSVLLQKSTICTSPGRKAQYEDSPKTYSSTAVHASILERSPDHQRLFKLLRNLSRRKRHDGVTTYFDTARIEQALHDLSLEDPPVKVAIVSTNDRAHAMRVQYAVMVALKNGLGGNKEQLPALKEPFEVRQGHMILSGIEGLYPLQLYASSLPDTKAPGESSIAALTAEPPKLSISAHKTLLVIYDVNGEPGRRNMTDGLNLPIYNVVDLKGTDVKIPEPLQDGDEIMICSDLAMQAVTGGNIAWPTWKASRIDSLKAVILQFITRPRDKERLAGHVRDFIAEILTTQLPFKLPSLATLSKQNGSSGDIPAAVNALIDFAESELTQQTLLSPLVSFNPLTGPANIAQLTSRLEKALLSKTETQARALDTRIQQSVRKEDFAMADPTPQVKVQSPHPPQSITSRSDDISVQQQTKSRALSSLASNSNNASSGPRGTEKESEPHLSSHYRSKIANEGLNDLFGPMRQGLQAIANNVNNNISMAQRNFMASSFSGVIGAGLIVFNGIDMTLGGCIFAAIVGVSNYRFKKVAEKEWLRFCRERVRLAQECLDGLKKYLHARSEGEVKQAAQQYEKKARELEQTKQGLKDARRLLLQMAPELKSQFSHWR